MDAINGNGEALKGDGEAFEGDEMELKSNSED